MAKKENRVLITLACNECKERNYSSVKNRKNDAGRIALNKYCRRCKKHTEHREQR